MVVPLSRYPALQYYKGVSGRTAPPMVASSGPSQRSNPHFRAIIKKQSSFKTIYTVTTIQDNPQKTFKQH